MTNNNIIQRPNFWFGFLTGMAMLVFFLLIAASVLLLDRIPYFFRTLAALPGLDDDQAELLEQLNQKRGHAVCSLAPPGCEDDKDLWAEFSQAAAACWKADLAPWRIRLAGGQHALLMKPPYWLPIS